MSGELRPVAVLRYGTEVQMLGPKVIGIILLPIYIPLDILLILLRRSCGSGKVGEHGLTLSEGLNPGLSDDVICFEALAPSI